MTVWPEIFLVQHQHIAPIRGTKGTLRPTGCWEIVPADWPICRTRCFYNSISVRSFHGAPRALKQLLPPVVFGWIQWLLRLLGGGESTCLCRCLSLLLNLFLLHFKEVNFIEKDFTSWCWESLAFQPGAPLMCRCQPMKGWGRCDVRGVSERLTGHVHNECTPWDTFYIWYKFRHSLSPTPLPVFFPYVILSM